MTDRIWNPRPQCTVCEDDWRPACADHPWDTSGFSAPNRTNANRYAAQRAASIEGKRAAGALSFSRTGAALYSKYEDITVNCRGCGVEFVTTTAPSGRRQFCSQACSARSASQRSAGTFVAAEPVPSAAERLAAAVARNPEAAQRYGLTS